MELVAEAPELKSGAGAEQYLYCACEDVEGLDGLRLDMLMLDECGSLLGTAQENVRLCFRKYQYHAL